MTYAERIEKTLYVYKAVVESLEAALAVDRSFRLQLEAAQRTLEEAEDAILTSDEALPGSNAREREAFIRGATREQRLAVANAEAATRAAAHDVRIAEERARFCRYQLGTLSALIREGSTTKPFEFDIPIEPTGN